jgi:hypothetical protein
MEHYDSERDRNQKIANSAAEMLRDAGMDGVVVLGCWGTEDGETAMVTSFHGNWYAQNGMMRHVQLTREVAARVDGERKFGE